MQERGEPRDSWKRRMTARPVTNVARRRREAVGSRASVAAAETSWSRFTRRCARSSSIPSSTARCRRRWPSSPQVARSSRSKRASSSFRISGRVHLRQSDAAAARSRATTRASATSSRFRKLAGIGAMHVGRSAIAPRTGLSSSRCSRPANRRLPCRAVHGDSHRSSKDAEDRDVPARRADRDRQRQGVQRGSEGRPSAPTRSPSR